MFGFVVTAVGWLAESIMGSLIGKAVDRAVQQFGEQHGVEDDRKKLEDSLAHARLTISIIESLRIKDEGLQRRLTDLRIRLKDAAYDADDLFDEFQYRILKQQIEQKGEEEAGSRASSSSYSTPPPSKKIKTSFSSYTSGLFGKGDVQRIREIKERLDGISVDLGENCRLLGLDAKDDTGKKQLVSSDSRQTSSFSTEPKLFGRDRELKKLKDLLLKPEVASESGQSGVSVLSIVGIGGIGKTTLAQEIFNDSSVKQYFALRIWVCVSENFCTVSLTRKIIEYATKKTCDLTNFAALQVVLKEQITSERFLLVLDDVWNEDMHKWESLIAPLRFETHGSKILVTTRSRKIADMVSNVDAIHLEGLDEESFWEFFKKCAFGSSNNRVHHPHMEVMAKKMTYKLKGLPLAAKTLGGLLSMKFDEQYWESILDSEIWRLPQEENDVMPVLQLSYQHLPLHLKQCFAFCSLYPKDHEFSESELIRIWLAEGFIVPQESIRMEELASIYFHELVVRSFFQKKSEYGNFIMHDLIHDLAELISEGESYRIEKGKSHEIPSTIRHLSLHKVEAGMQTNLSTAHYNKLRTYMIPNLGIDCGDLENLKRIRVLVLRYCYFKELPDSIGKLIHLRYLDLSNNYRLRKFPESLCNLYNLHNLILQNCRWEELPNIIGKLIHLRYLDLYDNDNMRRLPESLCDLYNLETLILNGCSNLESLPDGMMKLNNLRKLVVPYDFIPEITEVGKLTALQNLSTFKVLKEDGHKLAELNGLKHLRGNLCVTNLENVENKDEANTASLKSKEHLDRLELQWTSDSEVNSHISEQVLEGLQPHHNLRSLTISGYNGARPPNWLLEQVCSRLETLKLQNCKRWNDLSVVGQLTQLNYLCLVRIPVQSHDFQKLFDPKVCRFFSQLEILVLEGITLLEDLPNLGQLPCLKFLYILSLPGVKMIGDRFFATTEEGSCFPRLRILVFNEMTALEVFNCSDDRNLFPCLEQLEISNCQMLRTLPRLPPSITYLHLKNVGLVDCPRFWKVFYESSSVTNSASVTKLFIQECPNLTSLEQELLAHHLKSIRIHKCEQLLWMPVKRFMELISLESLSIEECPKLMSTTQDEYIDFQLPPSITKLCLSDCGNLSKSLPGCLHNLTALSDLTISNCPTLVTLSLEPFLRLTILKIENCNELSSVEGLGINTPQYLKITGCPKLLFSQGGVQTQKFVLLQLEIDDTALIKNFPPIIAQLKISSSCEVAMFEEEDQLSLQSLTYLQSLCFSDCKNLQSLPTKLYTLAFLMNLQIHNCPQIQSLPENGLPPALKDLKFEGCHQALEQQLAIHLAEIKKSDRYKKYYLE